MLHSEKSLNWSKNGWKLHLILYLLGSRTKRIICNSIPLLWSIIKDFGFLVCRSGWLYSYRRIEIINTFKVFDFIKYRKSKFELMSEPFKWFHHQPVCLKTSRICLSIYLFWAAWLIISSIIETDKSFKLTFSLSRCHFWSKPFPRNSLQLLFAFKQFFILSERIFQDDRGYSHQKKVKDQFMIK